MRLKNLNDETRNKAFVSEILSGDADNKYGYFMNWANMYRGGKVSGLRIYWEDGSNFVPGGHIRVYGIRNS